MKRLAIAAAVAIVVASLLFSSPEASAQSGGRLDLVAQTTWMGDLPAAIDLRVSGAPADARLTVRILAPVTTRAEVARTLVNPDLGAGLLAFFEVTDLQAARVGSGGVISIIMPDDEIGLLLRRDRGALTVVIDLMSHGTVLDTLVTHFLVGGGASTAGNNLGVAFVYDMRRPVALQPDLSLTFDPESVSSALDFLGARPDTPVSVRINAETLEAIDATGGSATDITLRSVLANRQLLLEPWVDLDEQAWLAVGGANMVISEYAAGRTSTENELATSPTGIVKLDLDSTPDTISLLRSAGATGLVVSPDQIKMTGSSSAAHSPLSLLDSNGVAIAAVVTDDSLLRTLSGPDPELSAQHAVVELALDAENLSHDGVEVIDISNLDPVAFDVLLAGIAASPNLHVATLTDALDLPVARTSTGAISRAFLISRDPPDLSSAEADLRVTNAALASYSSMITSSQAPIAPLRRLLRAAVSSSLPPGGLSEFTSRVFDAIGTGTRGISVVEGDRVTLASRTADLPLLIRNDQTLPITVDLFLRSDKLRFPDGEHRIVTLAPGDNPLTVRVEAPTSGDARVTIMLSSPDGRLELARGVVNVRSTAISGLGLIISIISLLILLTWWARTIIRVRRRRTTDSFGDPPDDDTTPSTGTQEGNSDSENCHRQRM